MAPWLELCLDLASPKEGFPGLCAQFRKAAVKGQFEGPDAQKASRMSLEAYERYGEQEAVKKNSVLGGQVALRCAGTYLHIAP